MVSPTTDPVPTAVSGGPDGVLATTARALTEAGLAAQLVDADGRLVWASEQLLVLSDIGPDDDIGLGETFDQAPERPVWRRVLTDEGIATLGEILTVGLADDEPLAVRAIDLMLGGRRRTVGMLVLTLRAPDGGVLGTVLIYAPLLPARVLAMLSEGDTAMFTRMADLATPAQRPAAVLFADIDGSGPLSRRLPTPVYFELVRAVTTAFDDLVARHGGIVGKHAGDGASGFFLAETWGSDSAAASAAIRVADALPAAVADAVTALADGGAPVTVDDCRFNVGVHWGANLFIGQVVTGGRLEVTALGDEVNECARVEHVARDGRALVTKTLVERLEPADAAALTLVPRELSYRLLADLADDDDAKARRDAGTLAVHDLERPRATPG